MLVTLFPIVTLVKPLHPRNASLPMLVTLSPIVTLVKPLHPENALPPMLVTLSGIVTEVILSKPLKASLSISSTPSAMTMFFTERGKSSNRFTSELEP